MRYYTETTKIEQEFLDPLGSTYNCDHPLYDTCTLYVCSDGRGLAVIQQNYIEKNKSTYWGSVDNCISNKVARNKNFRCFLHCNAKLPFIGLYPTITIRQLMWALRMKPIKKEFWETSFDHRLY